MLSPKEECKTSSFRHCFKVSVLTIYINALNFPEVMKRFFPKNSFNALDFLKGFFL